MGTVFVAIPFLISLSTHACGQEAQAPVGRRVVARQRDIDRSSGSVLESCMDAHEHYLVVIAGDAWLFIG